jgi:hypothetical protein
VTRTAPPITAQAKGTSVSGDDTPGPVPDTETWIYGGIRVGQDGKRRYAWIDPAGEEHWFSRTGARMAVGAIEEMKRSVPRLITSNAVLVDLLPQRLVVSLQALIDQTVEIVDPGRLLLIQLPAASPASGSHADCYPFRSPTRQMANGRVATRRPLTMSRIR